MDSYIIRRLWKPDIVLYVDINSRYSKYESERLDSGVSYVDFIDLSNFERPDAIIPYRNVYLVLAALNWVESNYPLELLESNETIEIAIGATAGDRVLDKSPEFAEKLSDLLTYLSLPQHWTNNRSRKVKVVLPYKDKTKRWLVREYLFKGYDGQKLITESLSCYDPDSKGNPCGVCKPCIRKAVALVLEGVMSPRSELARKAFETIQEQIIPQIVEGTYGRGQEEESEILEFVETMKFSSLDSIAVDFDGTLAKLAPFPEFGPLNVPLIGRLKELQRSGTKLCLWTCRRAEHLDAAIEACRELGLEFDYINEEAESNKGFSSSKEPSRYHKIFADIYIDDRAFSSEGFLKWCSRAESK